MCARETLARRLMHGERGETLVEFALAAVVFFIVLFGTMEFGIAVWRYNMVSDLAQEGARWASVRGVSSPTPATSDDVQAYVLSRALGIDVTATATPDPSGLPAGASVTVQVTNVFTPLAPFLSSVTLNLTNSATMYISK